MSVANFDYFSKKRKENWKSVSSKKILIVNTKWNKEIIDGLTKGAKSILEYANVAYDVLTVPGAYEIPLLIKKNIKKYDGFVALGALIKGDTFHFEAISYSVTNEISRLMMDSSKPISFGVLMVKKLKDAKARSLDNLENKGLESAAATLDMLVI